MSVTSITRAKGGTAEREVPLSEIEIRDIRTALLFAPGPDWMPAVERYHDALVSLLEKALADAELPERFFVPDLWHHGIELRPEEQGMVVDMWSLGHDLAKGLG